MQEESRSEDGASKPHMEREQVLAVLLGHADELRHRGVLHAALFGSLARGDATDESDIDILVEINPEAHIGLFGYVAVTRYIADLFPVRVDVANRRALKAAIRSSVVKDAIYAF